MSELRFHPMAREELRITAAHYREASQGLARAFLREVRFAADRVAAFPQSGAPRGAEIRRVLLRRFPFGLVYRMVDGAIEILAVMHLHREPSYWRDRIENK